MEKDISYVIITPVRNEEKYIESTIKSVIHQTLRPAEWIIVNDGSVDRTGDIVDDYRRKFHWIKKIDRKNSDHRQTGGKVIQVFNEGYNCISSANWDFIVKLDGDLSFGQDYFERLIEKFLGNKRLGIASGVYFQMNKNGRWKKVEMPPYHAAGACKVVRRECYEEIGGFVVSAGWDTVDEIRAIAKNWTTGHFNNLAMKHHKPEGSGIGGLKTSVMHGEIYYLTGGDMVFFILKTLHRIKSRPYFINALALLWGYARAALQRKSLLVNDVECDHYRKILRKRLQTKLRKMIL